MKKYGRTIAALGCCCVAASALAACSGSRELLSDSVNQEDGKTEGAWKTYADIPVTLDWYINFSWFQTGWGENMVSRKITDETGVSVNFITPAGSEAEKMNSGAKIIIFLERKSI